MRLFTAIDIDEAVREKLAALLHRLRPLAKLGWTAADRMHVTTKFIGEWPDQRLQEVKQALAGVASPGGMEITIKNLGWFPNARQARVFWAGVEGGAPLRALAQRTEDAVFPLGVPRENRDYSPHLTLARVREAVSAVTLEALRREVDALGAAQFGSFRAAAFYLYLSRAGQYTKLAEFPLP